MNAETENYAVVRYGDDYVQPLMLHALQSELPQLKVVQDETEIKGKNAKVFYFCDYEDIPFEAALISPGTTLINAYVIRKALIRKHFLSNTVATRVTKHPTSCLAKHFKPAVDFELDYAEFLDDALVECFELRESLEENESTSEAAERQWWILKPSMSDRGQGIRLFSTEEELQTIFEEWEADMPDSDEDEDDKDARSDTGDNGTSSDELVSPKLNGDYTITSQLRHFIAQPYIHPPLLLPSSENKKFHIRTYVLAVGALTVYVYKPMLALFAAETYAAPWEDPNLAVHLTNTCLQDGETRAGSVRAFWELEDVVPHSSLRGTATGLPANWKDTVFRQICDTTGELFEAAARGQMVHFQPLPNAFELFGLDFMVDDTGNTWLLEVNAFPDFKQTGDDLKILVAELLQRVIRVAVMPFFDTGSKETGQDSDLVKVLNIDLGRR